MKSETRANWIFLAIFMLLMGPGLVMLTIKGYKRGAAGINPPAPKTVAAYNNPDPQNPALPRVVPPQTAEFVSSIAYRLLKLQPELKRVTDSDGKPLMSEGRAYEIIAVGHSATSQFVALLGWNRTLAPLPSLFTITADGKVPAKLTAYEQLNMPLELRDELQLYNYVKPPDSVMWMIIEVPGGPVEKLDIRFEIDQKQVEDTLTLPRSSTTNPAR